MRLVRAAGLAWLMLAPGVAAAADVAKITECMRANVPQTVRIQTVEVAARDRTGGERLLKGRMFGTRENDRVRVMLRIEAPPDLSGAAYLVREADPADEMYMYLPSVNKVRRITGGAMDGKLWGTDLSYNDLKQIQNAFSAGTTVAEADGQIEGRPVHVLRFTPRAQEPSRYATVRAHVDQKTCVALRVEFFEGGSVRKEATVPAKSLKQSGKLWYASEALMRDLKDGTQTTVRVLGVTSGDKLSSRYFNPTQFYLGN